MVTETIPLAVTQLAEVVVLVLGQIEAILEVFVVLVQVEQVIQRAALSSDRTWRSSAGTREVVLPHRPIARPIMCNEQPGRFTLVGQTIPPEIVRVLAG